MQVMVEPRQSRKPGKKRNSYKLDEEKVTALHKAGVSVGQIAREQGVAYTTISRFINRTSLEAQHVEAFKSHRADILARIQMSALTVQEALLEDLREDGNLKTLPAHQKANLLNALMNVGGNAFDKERLERGQSTQNHSIMTRMLHGSVNGAYKSTGYKEVALPHGDHNSASETPGAPTMAAASDSNGPEEGRQGGASAAGVYGHPTESTRE